MYTNVKAVHLSFYQVHLPHKCTYVSIFKLLSVSAGVKIQFANQKYPAIGCFMVRD